MLLLKKEMHERTLKQSFDSELFILNSEQWILMNHLCCILKPFELVTREISSANASLIRDLSVIQILNLKLRRIKPSFWKDQEYFGKHTGQTGGGFLDGAIKRLCADSLFHDQMLKINVWKRWRSRLRKWLVQLVLGSGRAILSLRGVQQNYIVEIIMNGTTRSEVSDVDKTLD